MKFNKKYFIIAIIGLMFISLFFRYSRRAPKRHYSDFRVYYATGERFLQKEDIYSRPDEEIGPFKYSPMFAFVLSPLSLFSKKCASLIFFTINFFLVILIFILSKKIIVKDKISFRQNVFLCVVPLIFTSRFILQVLDSGQVGIIILSLVIIGLYFLDKNKNSLSAASIALSTMFKYTSFIFLPYFFFKKRIKLTALIVIFIILCCLLPAIYVGAGTHLNYIKSWFPAITSASLDKGSWYDYKNQSLFSLVLRFFTADSPYKISIANLSFEQGLILASIICLLIYLLIILPKNNKPFNTCLDYSSLFICMALFNPNAWMHNFVVLIFVYITLWYYLLKVNFKDKITLSLLIITFILTTGVSESIVGNNLENLFGELSSVTIGALILLFTLFRLKFKKQLTA